jgi:hypothetical protein
MGLNEAAGYVAVALAALGAGYLAASYALRPRPFVLGLLFAVAGLLLSLFFVRESQGHATLEAQQHQGVTAAAFIDVRFPAQRAAPPDANVRWRSRGRAQRRWRQVG